MHRPTKTQSLGATMDYGVLLSNYERTAMHGEGVARASQQHRLYACLRAAILSGQIEEGTRLA
eukprot:34590-Eustigmatos_ZCMA.PRE.1